MPLCCQHGQHGAHKSFAMRSHAGPPGAGCSFSFSSVWIIAWMLSCTCSFAYADRTSPPSPTFAQPDYTIYKSRAEVLAHVRDTVQKHSSIMQLDELAAEEGSYSTHMQVVTVEPGGLSIDHSRKLRFLLDFGEHGRELVTVEVALRVLELLGDPVRAQKLVQARAGNWERLAGLLQHSVFKIVPMENVHGREMVEAGNLCERKNGRGVDSNRNWPVHWGFREKDYDPNEEYPGTRPFSEPETMLLHKLAEDFEPHVWMNMHSGMEALFMPYDHLAALPDDAAGQSSFRLLRQLNALKCGGRCAVGSGGKSVGYLAHGTATDYMHDVMGVPLTFTWEIFGDTQAHFNDCFRMFNPLTAVHLEEVVANWADAVLAMVELMPASSEVGPGREEGFFHRRFLPTSAALQDGQVYNHTETDTAAAVREERMTLAFAVVASVARSEVSQRTVELWGPLAGVPTIGWVLLVSLLFLAVGLILGKAILREAGLLKGRLRNGRRKNVSAAL